MVELYDYELSSDAYKARLLLALLGVEYVSKLVEFYPGREHQAAWFLRLSPRGELPLLSDDGTFVEDAQSILSHIARRFDSSGTWDVRSDSTTIGQMAMWLSVADGLAMTAGAARLHDGFLYSHIDVSAAREGAHELLRVLDERLWFSERTDCGWLLSGPAPTIADIACFPDAMLAPEGGVELEDYRAVQRWGKRIKALPRWVPMPGIFSAL